MEERNKYQVHAEITKQVEDPASFIKAYAKITLSDCVTLHGWEEVMPEV